MSGKYAGDERVEEALLQRWVSKLVRGKFLNLHALSGASHEIGRHFRYAHLTEYRRDVVAQA